MGNRLKAMARDGQVNREGRPYRYRAVTKQDIVTGQISAHPKRVWLCAIGRYA